MEKHKLWFDVEFKFVFHIFITPSSMDHGYISAGKITIVSYTFMCVCVSLPLSPLHHPIFGG